MGTANIGFNAHVVKEKPRDEKKKVAWAQQTLGLTPTWLRRNQELRNKTRTRISRPGGRRWSLPGRLDRLWSRRRGETPVTTTMSTQQALHKERKRRIEGRDGVTGRRNS